MSMALTVVGKVVRGKRHYLLKDFDALTEDKLPSEYIDGCPRAVNCREGRIFVVDENNDIFFTFYKDKVYPKEHIDRAVLIMKEAGKRLRAINEKLRKENEGWEGLTTIIII